MATAQSVDDPRPAHPSRRQLLQLLAGLGIGSAVLHRALAVQAEKAQTVTPEMIQQAEWIAGLQLSEADRKSLVGSINQLLRNFTSMRAVKVANSVSPALA